MKKIIFDRLIYFKVRKTHVTHMTILKNITLFLMLLPVAACTQLYSGDGEYIVDRYYFFASYSIEFPEVPLNKEGVYVYNFDNYYTANSVKGLEFNVSSEGCIVPTIISTNIKFEVFDKQGALIAYMSSPLNKRELSFFEKPLIYPVMSWMGHCSTYYNSFDYGLRRLIAKSPDDKKLLDDYVRAYKISQCVFLPDHSPESPYHGDWDGGRIESFHKYKIVLTVSNPNTALTGIKGRLALRSGWK